MAKTIQYRPALLFWRQNTSHVYQTKAFIIITATKTAHENCVMYTELNKNLRPPCFSIYHHQSSETSLPLPMNHLYGHPPPPLYREVEGGSWIDEENLSLVKKNAHISTLTPFLWKQNYYNTSKKGLKPSFLRTHPISWPFYREDMNKASGLGK
jgi:hypothetical protein